jgi:hypothetical protein
MKRRFEIKRTPEIEALRAKYEDYAKDYIPGEEEVCIYRAFDYLTEWERVVLYALTEYKTAQKFADFFGVSMWTAKETIREIRDRVKMVLKKCNK